MTDEEAIEFGRLKTARDELLLTVAKLRGEIDALLPYKEKIEAMERAYDAHLKKSIGQA